MSKLALGCGGAVLLLLFILVTPFMFIGGGGSGAQAAGPPTSAGSPGSGEPVVVGGGTECVPAVGCQARPAELPYVPAGFYPDRFTGPGGECTSWAAALWPGHRGVGVTWSGDAWEWLADAARQGYAVESHPSVGAIVVWPRYYIPGNDATQFGHVAVVMWVTPTAYTVTEMNVLGLYRVDTRTVELPGDQAGFIPVPADAVA